jgi:DNA-binding MarR family transcriptional regulator
MYLSYIRYVGQDWTDRLLAGLAPHQPDLEMDGSQVVARIGRIGVLLARWQEQVFGRSGLNRGEVGVLGALRATEPRRPLSPSQLLKALLLSSAGITSRLDRLERRGLVRRIPDPDDRRGVLVELTETGERLVDAAVGANSQSQARMLEGMTKEELRALEGLLRKLQAGLETAAGDFP